MLLAALRYLSTLLLVAAISCRAERDAGGYARDDSSRTEPDREPRLHIAKGNSQRMQLVRDTPPTLGVYLALVESAQVLYLKFPPGFELAEEPGKKCGIVKISPDPWYDQFGDKVKDLSGLVAACQVSSSAMDTSADVAQALTEYVSKDVSLSRVTVEIKIESGGLRYEQDPGGQREQHWWYFGIKVWLPEVDPPTQYNTFELKRDSETSTAIRVDGFPIFGDWPCKYSDWEGWGLCSAQCGGGILRERRRVLVEPPPQSQHKRNCAEEQNITREVPCNTHPCEFKCELEDRNENPEFPAMCSADCGGGLKAQRWRWRGENCPFEDDVSAADVSSCNTQPCKVKCVLSDTWTVVTECSELCGMGTYRMMRMVLKKDVTDEACQPEWKEVPCVRQLCTPLTVLRPDRHVWPLVDDWYRVGLAFRLTEDVSTMMFSAPPGYAFGVPGQPCHLYQHDMMPSLRSCTVGEKYPDGTALNSNLIVLDFNRALLKNEYGRYHVMLAVKNPICTNDNYIKIALRAGGPGGYKCDVPTNQNMWGMTYVEEGKTDRKTFWAAGYDLYKSEASTFPKGGPGLEEFFGHGATNAADSTYIDSQGMWRARAIFCSARFDKCPDGSPCPQEGEDKGVCPGTRHGSGLPVPDEEIDSPLDLRQADMQNESQNRQA